MQKNRIRRPFFATTMKQLQEGNWIIIVLGFVLNIISVLSYVDLTFIIQHLIPICLLFANTIIYIINFVMITKKEKVERKCRKFMSGFIPSVVAFAVSLVMLIVRMVG